jgi:hypothetical protein
MGERSMRGKHGREEGKEELLCSLPDVIQGSTTSLEQILWPSPTPSG